MKAVGRIHDRVAGVSQADPRAAGWLELREICDPAAIRMAPGSRDDGRPADSQPRKKLYIETVGCQMNVLDSELVVGEAAQRGLRADRRHRARPT